MKTPLVNYIPGRLRGHLSAIFDKFCKLVGYDRTLWERRCMALEEENNRLKKGFSATATATAHRELPTEGLYVPSVNDFWNKSQAYPVYRQRPWFNLLKSYGSMAIREYIDQRKPSRVLEFGHGVWTEVDRCILGIRREGLELWGVDEFAECAYVKEKDRQWWEDAYEKCKAERPGVRFVRAYLGDPEKTAGVLVDNYFDLICSVSVLEELPLPVSKKILQHCYRLLAPGGKLMCSWDINLLSGEQMATSIVEILRECGFRCDFPGVSLPQYPLRESQMQVMLWYQQNEGVDRSYWGEYSTLLVQATKPGP